MQLEGPTSAGFLYSDTGGDGSIVVLLHGVLMNGSLWDGVVEPLRDHCRCIVPELPFGAHTTPLSTDSVEGLYLDRFVQAIHYRHVCFPGFRLIRSVLCIPPHVHGSDCAEAATVLGLRIQSSNEQVRTRSPLSHRAGAWPR